MKSLTRTSTAAALLLAVCGAFGVAAPAAAQPGYVVAPAQIAPRLHIERFVMRHEGDFRPGNELRFRLHGVPGVEAFFEIPGVLLATQMTEVRPGVYVGSYVIRPRDNPDMFFLANGILKSGTHHVTARVDAASDLPARGWGQRDRSAPQIVEVSPAHGDRVSERGWTRITARVGDHGSGVESVHLRIDGRDVSGRVRFDGDDIRYAEDLHPGRHSAELAVRDRAGNVARRSWFFDVVERDYGRRGYERW
jgi:hypothetical protein